MRNPRKVEQEKKRLALMTHIELMVEIRTQSKVLSKIQDKIVIKGERERFLVSKSNHFEEVIAGKQKLVDSLDATITERKETIEGDFKPRRTEYAGLVKSIAYLDSVNTNIKKSVADLDAKMEEKETTDALILIKKEELASFEPLITDRKKDLKDLDKQNKEARGELTAIYEAGTSERTSLKNTIAGVNEKIKQAKFYARRINKYYVSKGKKPPINLDDLSPKFFPSKKLQAKIIKKQNG